ncbi:hypothetical protein B7486_70435, partial [cyanobacterium TDX16]
MADPRHPTVVRVHEPPRVLRAGSRGGCDDPRAQHDEERLMADHEMTEVLTRAAQAAIRYREALPDRTVTAEL